MPRVVRIPGLAEPLTFPTGTSDEEIYASLADKLFPLDEAPEIPKPEAGFFGGLKEGVLSLGQVPSSVGYLYGKDEEARKAAAQAAESDYAYQQLTDIEGLGGLGRFVKEQAGQAVGFMAAPAASAMAASRVAPGPLKPIAAAGAFLTTAGAQYLGQTTGRQAQEQERAVKEGKTPEAPEVTKILATSAGQAGLDLFGLKFFKPLGQLLGLGGKKAAENIAEEVGKTAVEEGAEAAAKKLIGKESILKGAAKGAAVEAIQEPLQQILERYGAGLDLSSDEAISEYWQAAVAGGLLGAPLGGGSTYIENARRGAYNKDYVKSLQDAIEGKGLSRDQLLNEWNSAKDGITVQAPLFSFADDNGNYVNYTANILRRLGINPEAKGINVGTRSIPMEQILGQSTENTEIAGVFYNLFNDRVKQLDRKFKEDGADMTDEQRQNLVAEYEQAVSGLKTFKALLTPQRPVDSAVNYVVQPSKTDPKGFTVFNALTGQKVTETNFKSEETAKKFIEQRIKKEDQALAKVAEQKAREAQKDPTKVQAPASPPVTESQTVADVTAEQMQTPQTTQSDINAQLEAGIREQFGADAQAVLDEAQALLDAGVVPTYQAALEQASARVSEQIQADAEAQAAEVPVAPVAEEAGMTPEVPAEPQVTQEAATVEPQAEPVVEEAAPQEIPDTELFSAPPGVNPVEEIRALDPDPESEFTDLAEAAKTMPKESQQQLADLAKRLKRAYDTAQGKVPNASKADRDAAAEQINKIYDAIDSLQTSTIPTTPEGVQQALEANGNAKEAKKVANDVRGEACK